MKMEESMEHYKSNLREIRERIGISQDQLASATGISRRTIISMESDEGDSLFLLAVRNCHFSSKEGVMKHAGN